MTSYFILGVPILSMLANVSAQILCYKYAFKKGLLKSEYAGFIFGLVVFTACGFLTFSKGSPGEWLGSFLANLVIYACLSYCYFTFINMGQTARRVRLLRELYDAPQGLSREEMLSRYNAEDIINVRIARLLGNNQVILRDAKYYIGTPAVLFIAKMITLTKLIVSGRKSEFEK